MFLAKVLTAKMLTFVAILACSATGMTTTESISDDITNNLQDSPALDTAYRRASIKRHLKANYIITELSDILILMRNAYRKTFHDIMVDLQLREGSFMDREFHRYKLHELDDAQLAVSPKFYKWINSSIPRRVSEKVRTETYMNIVNTIIKNKKQQIVSNQTPKVILADLIEQAINNNVVNARTKDLIKLLRQRETEVASDVVSSTDKTVGHEV